MEKMIKKTEFLSCGDTSFPQIVVKTDAQDILALASSWHEMIEKYPIYSSVIGLTAAASVENVDRIIQTIGSDISFYDKPVTIGCFAYTEDNNANIDIACANPVSFPDPVFVIEKIMKSSRNAHCELLLIVIPGSDYPEQLIEIMDKLLDILSWGSGSDCYKICDYDRIFETSDPYEISIMIEKVFGISVLPDEISSKAKIRDLVNSIYLKKSLQNRTDISFQ